jgi:hypothetical protein
MEDSMRAKVTYQGRVRDSDTISIWDNDGREIAIHRKQIKPLIKLLKEVDKREYGQLGLEYLEAYGDE